MMRSSEVLPGFDPLEANAHEELSAISLANKLRDAVVLCDANGRIECASREAIDLWGMSERDTTGRQFRSLIDPHDRAIYQTQISNLDEGDKPVSFSLRILSSDGQRKAINLKVAHVGINGHSRTAHVMQEKVGAAVGTIGAPLLDDAVHGKSNEYVCKVSSQGLLVEASEMFCSRVDSSGLESIIGQPVERFLKIEGLGQDSALDGHIASQQGTVSGRLRCRGGRIIPVEVQHSQSVWQDQPALLYRVLKNSALIWVSIIADYALTQRESDVVLELCKGRSSADLASRLNISPATVRTHLRNVFSKTGVSSRVELISKIFNLLVGEMAACSSASKQQS